MFTDPVRATWGGAAAAKKPAAAAKVEAKKEEPKKEEPVKEEPKKEEPKAAADDEMDLFGDDDEDDEVSYIFNRQPLINY
jgi:DNA-nicking Smr family endonuclease